MRNREKLSVEAQIEHMKSLGIRFEIMDEEKAKDFLTYNTYFFKIKSYAKNYQKFDQGIRVGQYIDLDFAYLVELSTIDFHLSRLILKLTLDIEHALKVGLIRDITDNIDEDGYSIITDFLAIPGNYANGNLQRKKSGAACSNLIRKYEDNYPIWVILECLPFGDFISLYEHYYEIYDHVEPDILNFLWSAKFLRNSAAHCNCLINSLKKPYVHFNPSRKSKSAVKNKTAIRYLSQMKDIGYGSRDKKMSNRVINDFICTILLYDLVVKSVPMKNHRMTELHNFLTSRIIKNKEYFVKNPILKSTYDFVLKVFTNYCAEYIQITVDKKIN
ncbi:Abi family protein [Acetobacterium malicum]|uniref:Abi family protein n=1 Tax=Acetobacterium malicum TaxID=52692 RepID=A0ABR6Z3G2_9FIRM|nr:Abi family protein [Acetobacterium malicum]MBC3901671.1 Abi family protein [Acetobacterium malicum]